MQFLENNAVLVGVAVTLSIVVWLATLKMKSRKHKLVIRSSLVYLNIPMVYFGHPVLYFQVWMLLISYVYNLKLLWLLAGLTVWGLIVLAVLRYKKEI